MVIRVIIMLQMYFYLRTSLAIGSLRIKGPVTYTLVFIKIKSRRASIFLGYTIDASIKDIADSWFRMRIKSVQTGTKIICSLWLLCKKITQVLNKNNWQ